MHPNAFLSTLWRPEIRDEVFVAMSFDPEHRARYDQVIRWAIESQPFGALNLCARRTDDVPSGDSILTQIVDGVAHSRLVLADVSAVDVAAKSGRPVRNGNVMYEVGIALAVRSPTDVLLLRDDTDHDFLFDVSTIPHLTVTFDHVDEARSQIRSAIQDRLNAHDLTADARVQMLARTLTTDELRILRRLSRLRPGESQHLMLQIEATRFTSVPDARGIQALAGKGLLVATGITEDEIVTYSATPFGRAVCKTVANVLPPVGTVVEDEGRQD